MAGAKEHARKMPEMEMTFMGVGSAVITDPVARIFPEIAATGLTPAKERRDPPRTIR